MFTGIASGAGGDFYPLLAKMGKKVLKDHVRHGWDVYPYLRVPNVHYLSRCDTGDAMEQGHHRTFGPFHIDDTQSGVW